MTEFDVSVAGRIRLIRESQRLYPEDLARLAGLSAEELRAYEAGVSCIPAEKVQNLALALKIHVATLFGVMPPGQLAMAITDDERSFLTRMKLLSPEQRLYLESVLNAAHE